MSAETNTMHPTASQRIREARERNVISTPAERSRGTRNVLIATLAALAIGGGVQGLSNHNKGGPSKTLTYEVRPGDTEWSLANKVSPNGDTRETVYNLDQKLPNDPAHADHLVQPGDTLTYTSDGKIVSYEEPK